MLSRGPEILPSSSRSSDGVFSPSTTDKWLAPGHAEPGTGCLWTEVGETIKESTLCLGDPEPDDGDICEEYISDKDVSNDGETEEELWCSSSVGAPVPILSFANLLGN